ncbi:UL116 [Human betaherpesvirus 5]|uniref:UL116 n=2 Tax=Human cytomegalovirus TaxID=10359 RepID=Q6RXC9_HCMV|nr:UL116 [Human betaherpesvirus 5]ADD39151.1 protein UL116 [Human betaherpesvirus 5]AKI22532.1 protein UL116 [Human betaherpesvirus 5]AMJ53468.2 protein UL116 [Human betaherpesvirus 5]AND81863.1 protein UL116 [Human betaherpesvirus 5]
MKRRRRWRGWLLFLALCFCLLCEAVETNTTTVTSTTAAAATTNTTVATTGTTTTSPNVTSTTSSATSNSISTAPATSTVSEAKNTRNNTTTVGTNATSPSPSVSILTTVTPAATSTTSNGDVTSDYTPTFDLENITTTRAPTRPPAQDLCSHNLSIILYEEESQSSVDIAVGEEESELEEDDDEEYDELWFPLYFEAECNLNYTLQYVNHSCDYSVRQSSVSFPPWRDIDSVTFVPRNLSNCSAHGLAVIVVGNQTWYVNPFSLAHLLDAIYNVLGIEDLSANFRRQLAPYRHTLIVPQT